MKRLSNEEVDEIAVKYLGLKAKAEDVNGTEEDVSRFKAYQNIAAQKFKYLISFRAAKYRKFSNHPDLEQDGFEALISAFRTFDPNKGSFSWWADRYISTRIARSANAHSTIRFPIKKAKEMKPYKTSTIPIMIDEGLSPMESFDQNQSTTNIDDAIGSLPEKHQEVVNMTYGFNGKKSRSINSVMNDLSITRTQYGRILDDAKDKIKKHLVALEK